LNDLSMSITGSYNVLGKEVFTMLMNDIVPRFQKRRKLLMFFSWCIK
jgi:hypothetical protein